MSIVSEIERIKTNISNAYIRLFEKGATLPEVQNSTNLASTIESIEQSSGGGITVKLKKGRTIISKPTNAITIIETEHNL